MSSDITDKLQDILKQDIPNRHSIFQLNHFIIRKEPTIQAQMWQCLRELRTRRETIAQIKLEIEESKDRLELLNIQIEKNKFVYEQTKKSLLTGDLAAMEEEERVLARREIEVKIRQNERQQSVGAESLVQLERKLTEVLEETDFFVKTFEELQKIEELKPFDDPIAQAEYWEERLRQELNMRIILKHPIDLELAKTILALDDKSPIKTELVRIIQRVQNQEVLRHQK
jgi:hypothetical protein